ncbi:MAG: hypothetical protein ACLP3B_03550 [Syntrophobacteraceae bacterium]
MPKKILDLKQTLETIRPEYKFFEKLKSGELIPLSRYKEGIIPFPFHGDALSYYAKYGIEGGVWYELYPSVPIHEMILIPGKSKVLPDCASAKEFEAHYSRMKKLCSLNVLANFKSLLPLNTVNTGWGHLIEPQTAETGDAWLEYLESAMFEVEMPEPETEIPEQKPVGKKMDPLSTREGKSLLKAGGNEATRLYWLIERHVHNTSGDLEDKTKQLFKEEECGKPWKYIKHEYLDDPDLYQLKRTTHERADFVSRILQKILKEENIIAKNTQDLYHMYRKIK